MRSNGNPICVLVVVAALSTSGCGSSAREATTHATAAGRVPTLRIEAASNGTLRFSATTLHARAGRVRIAMTNPSAVPHDIAIKGHGVAEKGPVVESGGTSIVEATLKAGRYEFYCSVDGHEQAGMRGTLIVTARR